MRVIVQRVNSAGVKVSEEIVARIGKGLLIYVGITHNDTEKDLDWIIDRIAKLSLFEEDGLLKNSALRTGNDILVVSQFTLYASSKKGTRLSFTRAAKPDIASALYEKFLLALADRCSESKIRSGVFGAYMLIESVNDGPLTIIVDSEMKE